MTTILENNEHIKTVNTSRTNGIFGFAPAHKSILKLSKEHFLALTQQKIEYLAGYKFWKMKYEI